MPLTGGVIYRIWPGDFIALSVTSLQSTQSVAGIARVEYDDGSHDELTLPVTSCPIGVTPIISNKRAVKAGWVVEIFAYLTSGDTEDGSCFAQAFIQYGETISLANVRMQLAQGYLRNLRSLQLGVNDSLDYRATWVFQGTVAEDATGGTHVCTLAITPGAGNELELNIGQIIVGATATSQTAQAFVDDGAGHNLVWIFNGNAVGGTTTGLVYPLPGPGQETIAQAGGITSAGYSPVKISGTMRLVLQVSTAAVSVTQTFTAVCRLKGDALPTATLADSVGTPVLTTNVNRVF